VANPGNYIGPAFLALLLSSSSSSSSFLFLFNSSFSTAKEKL